MNEEYQVTQPHNPRKVWTLVGALIVVTILVLIAIYFTKVYQAQSSDSSPVEFQIRTGESATTIGHELATQKIISSSFVFLVYAYLNHAGNKIQAGDYQLDRSMSIAEIVDIITHGRVIPSDRSVTIIEGWTNDQIARSLAQKNIFAEVDFQHALTRDDFSTKFSQTALKYNYQGFLYPDTYKIGKTDSPQDLIAKMLKNFESKITTQMLADIEAQHRSLGDILILASIIEKEVGRNGAVLTDADIQVMQQERELVASVFYNRLAINMGLESDATVNYITGKGDRQPLIADTKIKSPYNTYQVRGLPPGPISNPAIGSIMAAIYPADADYLYFLNSPDGTAHFAKTLSEHSTNRAKYLK